MRRLFIAIVFIASILFSLPAQASMSDLQPSGGFLFSGKDTRIRTYTNYRDIYQISAEKIVGYDVEGSPLTEQIVFRNIQFDPSSTTLGALHCSTKDDNPGIVAVYSMKEDFVKYAWIFNGKHLDSIPISSVTCNKHLLLD